MFGKKKGFTASQSKRMSRKMQSNTVGSHVVRPPASGRGRHAGGTASRQRGAASVEFSNARRQGRANRGYVSSVGVSSTSGESASAYSSRVSRLGYVQEIQRKRRVRRVVSAVVLVAVVIAVAVGVGVATYFGKSDSRLALADSNAATALVAPEAGQPYYVLCAAQLGSAGALSGKQTDAYLLVRVDEQNRQVSIVSIPGITDVRLSDGQLHPLYDARSIGGDAELIARVSELAEVDIAHYVFVDEEGLAGMVDRVGGVSMTLPEEVDDPLAGTCVLRAGEQTLDGETALVMLRATNYSTGVEMAASNRVGFTLALANKALSTEGLDFASLMADAGNYIGTDLTTSQLIALGNALAPLDTVTTYAAVLPGYMLDGLYERSTDEWSAMLEQFKAGNDPNHVESSTTYLDPADVTVEVRNGAGATGAAARLGSLLESAGYKVDGVGNVDDGTTYPETFVIYNDSAFKGAAEAIIGVIGGGRAFVGGDFYTFDTDVLVIIGQDWMPVDQ